MYIFTSAKHYNKIFFKLESWKRQY